MLSVQRIIVTFPGRRFWLLGGALIAAAVVATIAVAATTVSTLTRVSGVSPYAACTVGGPGVNYTNAEVEPWVAVNPHDSTNLIGVWQQDRWNNGGSHGLVAGYSSDGGTTWGETALPFSLCAPGGLPFERATDPWVSIGPDGRAYSISVSFNQSNNDNAVAAATSTDGGQTWGNVRMLIRDDQPNFQFFNDKESVTADPRTAGEAYAVWDRLESPNGNPRANLHTSAYKGPALFSKTVDGGVTWSAAKEIVSFKSSNKQTIGNQIVVDRNSGTLYDFFDLIQPPFGKTAYKLAYVKSSDGGATWTQPQIVADMFTVGVTDPNTGEGVRTGDIIPDVAIDDSTGRLYAVWQDSRFNGGNYDEVVLSTSSDGGTNWSTPIRVSPPTGRPAFTASVDVNANGVVGVTYYDFRNLVAGNTTTLPTDYWLTTSSNNGASFGNEVHLGGPFDMKTAPQAGGFFVGDYQGLDSAGAAFKPFFVMANDGITANRTDVFTETATP